MQAASEQKPSLRNLSVQVLAQIATLLLAQHLSLAAPVHQSSPWLLLVLLLWTALWKEKAQRQLAAREAEQPWQLENPGVEACRPGPRRGAV
jgi:hypothetical protein